MFKNIDIPIAIRSGVAAGTGLLAAAYWSRLLEHPDFLLSGLWTVMTAIVVQHSYVGGTHKVALNRFLGILIGSVMGGFFNSMFDVNPLTLGISIAFTVILCSWLNLKDSIRVACMSVAVVMVLSGLRPNYSPWLFSFYRFTDSCIGILIGVSVSHLIWPSQAAKKLRDNYAVFLEGLLKHFRYDNKLETGAYFDGPKEKELYDLLSENKQNLGEARLEILGSSGKLDIWESLIHHGEQLCDLILSLKSLDKMKIRAILNRELNDQLYEVIELTEQKLAKLRDVLKKRERPKISDQLDHAVRMLDEELARFRAARGLRTYSLGEAQSFYVFFYRLKEISEILSKIEISLANL